MAHASVRDRVRGATFYVVAGQYAGFAIRPSEFGLRLILGWVAIGFMSIDMEALIGVAGDALEARPDA